jgi:5-methylcytosine-specific restriction endonuclease McrA
MRDESSSPTGRHAYLIAYYTTHADAERKRARDWYAANRERANASRRVRVAARPEKAHAYAAAYRAAHLEQMREYKRAWKTKHPEQAVVDFHRRRARLAGASGSHTAADTRTQYGRQKGRCYWCGEKVTWRAKHVDHVTPLSRGGSNGPENLVIACAHCNTSKGAKLPEEWAGRLC